jgi:hypothetical protein
MDKMSSDLQNQSQDPLAQVETGGLDGNSGYFNLVGQKKPWSWTGSRRCAGARRDAAARVTCRHACGWHGATSPSFPADAAAPSARLFLLLSRPSQYAMNPTSCPNAPPPSNNGPCKNGGEQCNSDSDCCQGEPAVDSMLIIANS